MHIRYSGSKRSSNTLRLTLGTLALLVPSFFSGVAAAHGQDYGDPANPESFTAPLIWRGAVGPERTVDVRPRSWCELFSPTGQLRVNPPLAAKKPDLLGTHADHGGDPERRRP